MAQWFIPAANSPMRPPLSSLGTPSSMAACRPPGLNTLGSSHFCARSIAFTCAVPAPCSGTILLAVAVSFCRHPTVRASARCRYSRGGFGALLCHRFGLSRGYHARLAALPERREAPYLFCAPQAARVWVLRVAHCRHRILACPCLRLRLPDQSCLVPPELSSLQPLGQAPCQFSFPPMQVFRDGLQALPKPAHWVLARREVRVSAHQLLQRGDPGGCE
eukprot:scaffold31622_cov85-Phaeocystis_antarctica.AAC.2